MRGKTIVKIVIALAIVAVVYGAKDDIAKLWQDLHVKIVERPAPKKTVWLDQGIPKEKLSWFYHADQGTRTFGFPFEWFMALEQPTISWMPFAKVGLFSDTAYLDRYGFIPDTVIPGKEALPIGFAKGTPMLDPTGAVWRNPRTKKEMIGVGLTCAACHTGSFTYKDTAVVIDGGPALTNLFAMKQGMGISLLMTRYLPGRFDRFAERILGTDATLDDRAALKTQIDQVLDQYKQVKNLEARVASHSLQEGYGRLDALNRIGNQVFSIDLKNPENYAGSSAPVHYPRIWNTPWFDWVQYNGSIMQPMVRNAGESLGVSAELNLTDPSKGLYKSSVDVDKLFAMEQMIKGDTLPNAKTGFPGLQSPKWPADILPPIDQKLADKGAELYKTHCQECHRPPVTSEAFYDFNNKNWWRKNEAGEPILVVENIPISHIGTDPAQAADMIARTVAVPGKSRHQEQQFRVRAGRTGREDRQLCLRSAKAARHPGRAQADRRLYAERTPRRACLQGTSAQRHMGDAALPAQRFGADHRRPARRPRETAADILSRQPRIRPREARLQDRPDRQRLRIRHLDSRQFEQGPRIQEGFQQGQGNPGRDRAGAVGGRSKGVDRISQDALRRSERAAQLLAGLTTN